VLLSAFHSSPPVDSLPNEVIESATSSDIELTVDLIVTMYTYRNIIVVRSNFIYHAIIHGKDAADHNFYVELM